MGSLGQDAEVPTRARLLQRVWAMTLTLIIIGYALVAALTAYLLGRFDDPSVYPIALAWPLVLPLEALRHLATLGAKHRRGE